MKILYIITQGEQGGGQKYVLDLATGINTKEVFVGIGRIENEGDKWLFQRLEKQGIKKENIFEIKNLQREINLFSDLRSVWDIYKLIQKIGPDIVHLNSSKAGFVGSLASYFTKAKAVYTVHGFVFLEPMHFIKKYLYIFIEYISAKLRDYTIFITEKDIQSSPFQDEGRTGGRSKLVYNGVDEKKRANILGKQEAREFIFNKIQMNDSGKKIVGTISNFFKTKGLEYLVDSAKNVDAIFVVFGFGDEIYKEELQTRIIKNNLQERFFLLGRVPDAYRYLPGVNVFTLTSLKEGLPYSLIEASLSHLPIVATSVGGIPEIAKNITMTLVESKNVQQISDAIKYNLANQEICKTEFNTIYSLDNMLRETEIVYRELFN